MTVALRNYNPLYSLRNKLVGYWDASDASTLFLSGSSVTMWRDKVAGYPLTQGSLPAQPTYSATSLGGGPGVLFDGIDDNLVITPAPSGFPVGATPFELWVLCALLNDPLEAATLYPVSYGNSGSDIRALCRITSVGGANRLQARFTGTGTSLANLVSGMVGVGFVRMRNTGTDTVITQNGLDSSTVTAPMIPNGGGTRFRIGARAVSTADLFCNINVGVILIFNATLTDAEVARLGQYLSYRRGT
jgi:hypothetical protein